MEKRVPIQAPPPPPLQEFQAIIIFYVALVGTAEQHHCALSRADDTPQNVGRRDGDGDKSSPLVDKCCRTISEMSIPSTHGPEAQFSAAHENIIRRSQ